MAKRKKARVVALSRHGTEAVRALCELHNEAHATSRANIFEKPASKLVNLGLAFRRGSQGFIEPRGEK